MGAPFATHATLAAFAVDHAGTQTNKDKGGQSNQDRHERRQLRQDRQSKELQLKDQQTHGATGGECGAGPPH